MTSTKAGSAICDCDNPDDCTHKIDITLGDKTFSYTQSWFPQALYYVLDAPKTTFTSLDEWPKEEKPNVEIKLSSVSKGCISHNPKCPIGNVFNEQGHSFAQFYPKNTYKGKLFYDKTYLDFLTLIPGPFMILKRFLDKDFYAGIEKQHYLVMVDECSNKPLTKETQSIIDKASSYLRGQKTVLNSNIYLVTKEKIDFDLTFSADKEVDEFTDQERKNQQRKNNREQGQEQRGYRGWRNSTTRYAVRNSYSIKGSLKTQKGEASQTWEKTILEKKFKKSKNTLKPIDSFKQNIDKFTDFLTAGHPRDKFKILKLEVLYPEIKANGNYELSHSDDFKLYRKFGIEVSASPLFGLSLKLDVIQLAAAFLKINTAVSMLREAGEFNEEEVKKGKAGAYAGTELSLIAKGNLDVKFGWESDEKGSWSYKKNDIFEVGFSIKAEASIRGGVRYGIIYGYVNAAATADAKALIGFAPNPQNEKVLDLVLYHDGIKAMVNVELAFGVGKKGNENDEQRDKGINTNAEKEWVFQNHCLKKIRRIGFHWISVLFLACTLSNNALGKSKMDYKYLLSMNTSKSFCYLSVNGMPAMDNRGAGMHGVQSSGLNATAFLENGANTIELLFKDRTSEKSNKFDHNARCETTLKKVSAIGDEEIISHIKLTVDKEGNTLTSESLNQIGRTESEFEFLGMSTAPGDEGFYKARKSFNLNKLPDWMWTKARPVTENDLPAIKNFYQEIINTLAHKDLDKLWKMSKPAWDEWGIADNSNAKIFFDSMNFEELTDSKIYTLRMSPKWQDFRLVKYKEGRLFRLEKGIFGRSPIIMDENGTNYISTYDPYLSIINGKVIIAR